MKMLILLLIFGSPAIVLWMALAGPGVGGEHNFYE